jgi:predicted RecB family nuclease
MDPRAEGKREFVPLTRDLFTELDELVKGIVAARLNGVPPRVCQCVVCSDAARPKIRQRALDAKDLTAISGIGWKRARALAAKGYCTHDQLRNAPPGEFSLAHRSHAQSYEEQRPVAFARARCDVASMADYVVMDLEYDNVASQIWMFGCCVVRGGTRRSSTLWVGAKEQEALSLQKFLQGLKDLAPLPILTFSGTNADFPELRKAAQRHQLDRELAALEPRHVDLRSEMMSTVRLPIPHMGLKDLGSYWGIRSRSPVAGGAHALELFHQYGKMAPGEERALLRRQLHAYVRDDLRATAISLRKYQRMMAGKEVRRTSASDGPLLSGTKVDSVRVVFNLTGERAAITGVAPSKEPPGLGLINGLLPAHRAAG